MYGILVVKPLGRRQFEKFRSIFEGNIKIDLLVLGGVIAIVLVIGPNVRVVNPGRGK
jgi:hypothetical protein